MGCRIPRWVTLVMGEMDVVRVNPYRSDQGEPSVYLAWWHGRWVITFREDKKKDR